MIKLKTCERLTKKWNDEHIKKVNKESTNDLVGCGRFKNLKKNFESKKN